MGAIYSCGVDGCKKEWEIPNDTSYTIISIRWRRGFTGGRKFYCVDHLSDLIEDMKKLPKDDLPLMSLPDVMREDKING